jgi:hypothetical protein
MWARRRLPRAEWLRSRLVSALLRQARLVLEFLESRQSFDSLACR